MSAAPQLVQTHATYTEELIGPELARKYLATNAGNRPRSRGVVWDYVGAMISGEWLFNGEAIKFDRDGKLVDGQHRLDAVIKSGKEILFLVIRGLDPEVFKTIDTGKKRSAGDVLAIRGVKNPNSVGAAMRLVHRTLAAELGLKKRISNTILDELRAQHPRMVPLMEEADKAPYATALLTPTALMFAFYMAVHVDEARARTFFRVLAGRRVGREQSQPAEKLRERLAAVSEELVPPPPKVRLAWVIGAWNLHMADSKADRFSRVIAQLPDWTPAPRFGP
jgi:hypothetical protein